mmetsp:Transcript_28656/g.77195  ORF Transcript_28656/g.77195 Transcript_28656/m.77195 type:complete len:101 (-) Transcript_28656:412-714(-)
MSLIVLVDEMAAFFDDWAQVLTHWPEGPRGSRQATGWPTHVRVSSNYLRSPRVLLREPHGAGGHGAHQPCVSGQARILPELFHGPLQGGGGPSPGANQEC